MSGEEIGYGGFLRPAEFTDTDWPQRRTAIQGIRNGIPERKGYVWRARDRAHEAAIAAELAALRAEIMERIDAENERYATLQAENLAAADVDWDAREMSD